jgi:perosamine synthetase
MKLFALPRSRFRVYGGPGHYASVATDIALGRVNSGDAVERAEARLCEFLGSSHAIAMPQARIGIYFTLKALAKRGQNVVLSPYTIHDVVNMVICAGARPVFADIDRETCNINAQEVERLIDGNTAAVMVTHLHGLACDIEAIAAICRRRNVPLVEDASQAFGATVNGRRVGSFGDAGIFSFGMAKNINSFYGGVVVTGDAGLASSIRDSVRNLPYQSARLLMNRVAFCAVGDVLTMRPVFDLLTFWVYRYGHLRGIEAITKRWRGEDDPVAKSAIPDQSLRRMTPMQARLIVRSLDHIDADTKVRIEYARMYDDGLRDVSELMRPPMREDGSHIYLAYPVQAADRDRLLRYLIENGRDLAIQHIGNCADYACFAEYHRDCPNAREAARSVLLLPTYPSYGRRQVAATIDAIRAYYGRPARR